MARQKGWKVTGQVESGKEGTPHLQLHVNTPQVRFSAIKKAFTRAHIEAARNSVALEQYVNKQDTRLAALPAQQDMYPSAKKFWQLVLNKMLYAFDKDGLDYVAIMDGHLKMYRREDEELATHEQLLDLYKRSVGLLIREGYFVEMHYCNPANKSAFKDFATSLLLRAHLHTQVAETTRQTDDASDTDGSSLATDHTPDAPCQVQVTLHRPPSCQTCPDCTRPSSSCSCSH